jgi:hypothetical protein
VFFLLLSAPGRLIHRRLRAGVKCTPHLAMPPHGRPVIEAESAGWSDTGARIGHRGRCTQNDLIPLGEWKWNPDKTRQLSLGNANLPGSA